MASNIIDNLIDDVRKATENEDFSDTSGIQEQEFIRFLNEGQEHLHARITQQHPSVFLSEQTISITADTEEYSLASDIFIGNKVTQVDYSPTGNAVDYIPLRAGSLRERRTGADGDPQFYIRRGGSILINPVPTTGTGSLRVTYMKRLPKLDKRRASISAVTLNSSNNTITTLTLNVSTDTIDSTALAKSNYMCIVTRNGGIQMKAIEFDSINTTTGAVTVTSGFTYTTGETATTSDYIVGGENSTTHTQLDESLERYLIAYATWKILKRDSNSAEADRQQQELLAMEDEIIANYAELSDDIMEIPEIISDDDDWVW